MVITRIGKEKDLNQHTNYIVVEISGREYHLIETYEGELEIMKINDLNNSIIIKPQVTNVIRIK